MRSEGLRNCCFMIEMNLKLRGQRVPYLQLCYTLPPPNLGIACYNPAFLHVFWIGALLSVTCVLNAFPNLFFLIFFSEYKFINSGQIYKSHLLQSVPFTSGLWNHSRVWTLCSLAYSSRRSLIVFAFPSEIQSTVCFLAVGDLPGRWTLCRKELYHLSLHFHMAHSGATRHRSWVSSWTS